MKVLENASSSTSLIRSCMDKSLKRKKGYQKIPFPGHRCGKHRSSFMISTTILRAACETSHMIQQGLYFPLTWINDKRNFLGNSLVLSLIHLYADDQSCKHREGRDQPLPSISGAKNTWKLLFCFHGENPISGVQDGECFSFPCQSSVCLISTPQTVGPGSESHHLIPAAFN